MSLLLVASGTPPTFVDEDVGFSSRALVLAAIVALTPIHVDESIATVAAATIVDENTPTAAQSQPLQPSVTRGESADELPILTVSDEPDASARAVSAGPAAWLELRGDDGAAPTWIADDNAQPSPIAVAPQVAVAAAAIDGDLPVAAAPATIVTEDDWRPLIVAAVTAYRLELAAGEESPTAAVASLVDDQGGPSLTVADATATRWAPASDETIAPAWLVDESWSAPAPIDTSAVRWTVHVDDSIAATAVDDHGHDVQRTIAATAIPAPQAYDDEPIAAPRIDEEPWSASRPGESPSCPTPSHATDDTTLLHVTDDDAQPQWATVIVEPAASPRHSDDQPATIPPDDDGGSQHVWWSVSRIAHALQIAIDDSLPASPTGELRARESLFAYVAAQWSGVPMTFEGEAFTPTTDTWIRVSMAHTTRAQVTQGPAGERRFECRGYVFVQLFTAVDAGQAPTAQLADQVVAAIEGVRIPQTGTTEPVIVRGAATRELGQDGRWNMAVVVAPFTYNDVR